MGVFYVVDSENGLRVIAAPVCQTLLPLGVVCHWMPH